MDALRRRKKREKINMPLSRSQADRDGAMRVGKGRISWRNGNGW